MLMSMPLLNRKSATWLVTALAALSASLAYLARAPRGALPIAPGAPASPAPASSAVSDSGTEGSAQSLRGPDFVVEVSGDDEGHRYLSARLDSGKALDLLERSTQGETRRISLEDVIFDSKDRFSLESVIPGDRRPQLIVRSSTWLQMGLGSLKSQLIYRVTDEGILEVGRILLERKKEATGSGEGALDLAAAAELRKSGTEAAYLYRYREDGGAEKTLELRWDGTAFADPSGVYSRLLETYQP